MSQTAFERLKPAPIITSRSTDTPAVARVLAAELDLVTPEVKSDRLFDAMDSLTARADALLKEYDEATSPTAAADTPASAVPSKKPKVAFKATPRRTSSIPTPSRSRDANLSVICPRSPAVKTPKAPPNTRENTAPNSVPSRLFSPTASSRRKSEAPRDEVTQLQFAAAMSPSRGGLFPVYKAPPKPPAYTAPPDQAPDAPAAELVAAVASMLAQEKEHEIIDEWMAGVHADRLLDDDEKLRQASVAQFGAQFGAIL